MTRRTQPATAALAVLTGVLAAVTTAVTSAGAALAQTTTTLLDTTPKEPDPLNAGGIVFLFVSAVIFGGALILYLRHRQPRPRTDGARR